ncbi:MAG TPA: hypothetical protein VN934_08035 [Candidatus Tumulicola sp.]|nr:hypothetical protein [Candidatus Tumulicola sp.]
MDDIAPPAGAVVAAASVAVEVVVLVSLDFEQAVRVAATTTASKRTDMRIALSIK